LEKKRKQGLQKKLICLVLDDNDTETTTPLHGQETIWRNGICVGIVRSTAYGHSIGKTICYGYVNKDEDEMKVTNKWLKNGAWNVGDRGNQLKATLHLKAPFDPTNGRIRGEY